MKWKNTLKANILALLAMVFISENSYGYFDQYQLEVSRENIKIDKLIKDNFTKNYISERKTTIALTALKKIKKNQSLSMTIPFSFQTENDLKYNLDKNQEFHTRGFSEPIVSYSYGVNTYLKKKFVTLFAQPSIFKRTTTNQYTGSWRYGIKHTYAQNYTNWGSALITGIRCVDDYTTHGDQNSFKTNNFMEYSARLKLNYIFNEQQMLSISREIILSGDITNEDSSTNESSLIQQGTGGMIHVTYHHRTPQLTYTTGLQYLQNDYFITNRRISQKGEYTLIRLFYRYHFN